MIMCNTRQPLGILWRNAMARLRQASPQYLHQNVQLVLNVLRWNAGNRLPLLFSRELSHTLLKPTNATDVAECLRPDARFKYSAFDRHKFLHCHSAAFATRCTNKRGLSSQSYAQIAPASGEGGQWKQNTQRIRSKKWNHYGKDAQNNSNRASGSQVRRQRLSDSGIPGRQHHPGPQTGSAAVTAGGKLGVLIGQLSVMGPVALSRALKREEERLTLDDVERIVGGLIARNEGTRALQVRFEC